MLHCDQGWVFRDIFGLRAAFGHCRHLKHANVSNCERIHGDLFAAVAVKCAKHLTHVEARNCYQVCCWITLFRGDIGMNFNWLSFTLIPFSLISRVNLFVYLSLNVLVSDSWQFEPFKCLQTASVARHQWLQARQRQLATCRKVQGPRILEPGRLPWGASLICDFS